MIKIEKNDIIKELDAIQSCIERMSKNSFSMKGWHITIVSALLIFFFKEDNVNFVDLSIIIIFITTLFWYLDSYYLLLERKYRWKYQWILDNRLNSSRIDSQFFMNLNPNNNKMWVSATNSISFRLAKYSSERKHIISRYFSHFIEVIVAMFANTLEIEYMLLIISLSTLILFVA